MNRREDELIRCAFGDLEPQDAEQIRARCQGDPKMARELADYEAMKQGLKQLRDIPEMQLSRERLKDAILAEGLKPAAKQAPWWDRLAWPVALAGTAAVAFLVVVRLRPAELPLPAGTAGPGLYTKTEPVKLNPGSIKDDTPVKSETYLAMEAPKYGSVFNFTAPEANSIANRTIVDSAPTRSHRLRSRRSVAKEEAPAPSVASLDAEKVDAPVVGAPGEFDMRDSALEASARREQGRPEDQGIVVIDPGQTEAGTQRAVEMEGASNVLVGG